MGKAKRCKAIHAAEGPKQYNWTPGSNRVSRRANGQVKFTTRLRDKVQPHWLQVAKTQREFEKRMMSTLKEPVE